MSVAAVDLEGEEWAVRTRRFSKHPARSFERLRAIRHETEQFVREFACEFPPAFVLLEEPGGQWIEPQLQYAVGCIQSCIPIVGPGATVAVSKWKLHGLGYGAAKKPDIFLWAQRKGYGGTVQDEADALGIAFACRALHRPQPVQESLAAF